MAAERAHATRKPARPRPDPASTKGDTVSGTAEPEGGTADSGGAAAERPHSRAGTWTLAHFPRTAALRLVRSRSDKQLRRLRVEHVRDADQALDRKVLPGLDRLVRAHRHPEAFSDMFLRERARDPDLANSSADFDDGAIGVEGTVTALCMEAVRDGKRARLCCETATTTRDIVVCDQRVALAMCDRHAAEYDVAARAPTPTTPPDAAANDARRPSLDWGNPIAVQAWARDVFRQADDAVGAGLDATAPPGARMLGRRAARTIIQAARRKLAEAARFAGIGASEGGDGGAL
jgi:hypothetical protein